MEATYAQFEPGSGLRGAFVLGALVAMPLALPFALLGRLSDIVFRSCSELLALVPYLPGVLLRNAFYRLTLPRCGANVVVEFGTILVYRDVQIGDDVLIGRFNVIHHCDFGSGVLTSERCTFLSGSRQHGIARTDVPIARQPGEKRRITVGSDTWIGAHAVVMADVGDGAVVGAGAVVHQPVPSRAVVVGVPARVVRMRGEVGLEREVGDAT